MGQSDDECVGARQPGCGGGQAGGRWAGGDRESPAG